MARFDPRIAVSVGLGLVVQFALTILAWGDWQTFFDHPARLLFVIASILLGLLACFSGSSGISGGQSHSPASKRILLPMIIVLIASLLIPPYCDRRNIWSIDNDVTRYFGLILFLIGSILRLMAVFALGPRFSGLVAIQAEHKLKTDGIYQQVRHPSYTGLLVATIGSVLVFRSTIGLLLTVALFFLLLSRMNDEERFLEAEFGDEYRVYRQKTWRLLPYVY